MSRDVVVLACDECRRRNYTVTKNRKAHPERMQSRKYCASCRHHTEHRETR